MLKANQHFIFSFFGPLIAASVAAYGFYLIQSSFELQTSTTLIGLLLVAVMTYVATRWVIHSFVPVICPRCRGRCYEMEGRGGRFMCMVCGRDH
jgi:predicted PurR-regulated permease PerM